MTHGSKGSQVHAAQLAPARGFEKIEKRCELVAVPGIPSRNLETKKGVHDSAQYQSRATKENAETGPSPLLKQFIFHTPGVRLCAVEDFLNDVRMKSTIDIEVLWGLQISLASCALDRGSNSRSRVHREVE